MAALSFETLSFETLSFETLGNATLQLFVDGAPLLVTDPWLRGTCYFGSWELERPPDGRQIANAVASRWVWISHGHPDHLHEESLALFPAGTRVLIADHYSDDIHRALASRDFDVTVMGYREWMPLGHGVEALCLDNPDQDAVLVIRTPDALIINLNDCQLWGEARFLRGLVRACGGRKTFLLALCDFVGDMCNIVGADGRRVPDDLDARKEGTVRRTARIADRLGVAHYCCSSFQHRYCREDSAWANAGKIEYADMKRYWSRPRVKLVEPFVTVDLETLAIAPSGPEAVPGAPSGTAGDDWSAPLEAGEWARIEAFFRRFETLRGVADFIAVTVAGERRDIVLDGRRRRGVHFRAPRASLMAAVDSGYFDDMLLGNFMATELIGMRLYPDFTPRVAKIGGNAGVFTMADLRRFRRHYGVRDRRSRLRRRLGDIRAGAVALARVAANRLGIARPARTAYWWLLGDRAPDWR
ncbi:MAG: hypothetical protein AB7O49_15070 [Sphingomonadales bacterium]